MLIESVLIVSKRGKLGGKELLFVVDVSRTVYSQWIVIKWRSDEPFVGTWLPDMITSFRGIDDLMLWCAKAAEGGALFQKSQLPASGIDWLNQLCADIGYGSWASYMAEQRRYGNIPGNTFK